MHDITCSECPWHDTRPATNSRLSTCPNCGADQLTYEKHIEAIDAEPALDTAPVIAAADAPTPPPD